MKLLLHCLVVLSFLMSHLASAKDAGSLTTKDFSQVEELLLQNLFRQVQPEEVLVVFDIDNTLLRLREDLGSEQWFMWQRELIDKGEQSFPSVTYSIENLLTVQSWIYNAYPMEVVDPLEKSWIKKLRHNGAAIIALTSRSLNVQRATLREMRRNSIPLSPAATLGLDGDGQTYIPYQLESPENSGLTTEDITYFKLGEAKPVLFEKGVFFTQGQHKGAMLKTFLNRMNRKFKAVVFIDDRSGHIQAMRAMAATIPHDVVSIHFNLSEDWTLPFFNSEKNKAQSDWCDFADYLNAKVFPNPEARAYRTCTHHSFLKQIPH